MNLKKTTHMKYDIINQAQSVVSILYSLHIRMCILYKYIYSTTKLHDHVHGIMECKRQKYSLPEKKSRENIGQIF